MTNILDIVALWFQSQRLQGRNHAHRSPAGDALYAEALAAQIFGPLDAGADDQFVVTRLSNPATITKSAPSATGAMMPLAVEPTSNVARQHAGQQRRPASRVDNFRVELQFILLKKP